MGIEFCITEVDISLLLLMCCEERSFVGCFLYGKAQTQVLSRLALLFEQEPFVVDFVFAKRMSIITAVAQL